MIISAAAVARLHLVGVVQAVESRLRDVNASEMVGGGGAARLVGEN